MKKIAEEDGCLERSKAEFEALAARINPDLDADLDANRADISKYICYEIARRYFYQKGVVQEQLKDDKGVNKALEILQDRNSYNALLTKAKVGDEPAEKEEDKSEDDDLTEEEGEAE